MDYGFTHDDTVYTPNRTVGIAPAESTARNTAIEAAELTTWAGRPDRVLAYYDGEKGIVTTWPGTVLGTIVTSRIYRHNFGGRFISLAVRGTNGARYSGRASYDWGQCVRLRRVK